MKLTGTKRPCGLTTIFAWRELPRACSLGILPDQIVIPVSGGDGGGETPVPIPNTVVKPSSADGTARSPCGRVGRRRISLQKARDPNGSGPFCFRSGELGFCRSGLDAFVLRQITELARDANQAVAPGGHVVTSPRQVGVVAGREPQFDRRVSIEQLLPGCQIGAMKLLYGGRLRDVCPGALEMRQDPRPIVGDLVPNFSLVDELGREDSLEASGGFRLDGCPGGHLLKVVLDVASERT